MIDRRQLDQRATLADAEATLAEQLRLDVRQLALAGHRADLHSRASLSQPAEAGAARRAPTRPRWPESRESVRSPPAPSASGSDALTRASP